MAPALLTAVAWLACLYPLIFVVGLWETMLVWPYESTEGPTRVRPVADLDASDPYAPSVAPGDDPTNGPNAHATPAEGETARPGFAPLGPFCDVGRGPTASATASGPPPCGTSRRRSARGGSLGWRTTPPGF